MMLCNFQIFQVNEATEKVTEVVLLMPSADDQTHQEFVLFSLSKSFDCQHACGNTHKKRSRKLR